MQHKIKDSPHKSKIWRISFSAFLAILLSITIFSWSDALAVRYYVDESIGSDNFPTVTGGSWSDPFATIQYAIIIASNTDEIWVKAGVYNITTEINLTEGIAIVGGFAGTEASPSDRDLSTNVTIVDGQDLASVNHGFLVNIGNTNDSATIDGFTITRCGMNDNISNSGGGIYVLNSVATIANCLIENNETFDGYGGGVAASGSVITVIDCTLHSNNASDFGQGGGISVRDSSNATITNSTFSRNVSDSNGGALYSENSSLTITDCTFSENATGRGRGAAMSNNSSLATITNCNFFSNDADEDGGAIYNDNSSPTITNCTFSDNNSEANGGAICNTNASSPNITGCTFSANTARANAGGAIANRLASAPAITGCIFNGNSADEGGAISYNSNNFEDDSPIITNCIFINNAANTLSGGAIINEGQSPTITNCTFFGNSADVSGGAIYNFENSSLITNCIFWGNTPQEISNNVADPTFNNCDIEGSGGSGAGWNTAFGSDGGGNIDIDPLFVNSAAGDFHLQALSPCIDSGNNSAVAGIATDLDGNPRIVDGDLNGTLIVDMGVYEYSPNVEFCPDADDDGYVVYDGNCFIPAGKSAGDCDDTDPAEYPGQSWYPDVDGDDYYAGTIDTESCERPANYKTEEELDSLTIDCAPANSGINPGATEIPDNTVDENCDGVLGDVSAPDISMSTPGNGTSGIAVDTNIIIQISDSALGVDDLTINVAVVQQVASNPPVAVAGSTVTNPTANGYEVTFTPDDPLENSADVTVTVNASDNADPVHSATGIFTFTTTDGETVDTVTDTDGDGITDHIENTVLHTRADLKTLFVRPLIESETVERSYSFWSGFKSELFPDPDPVHGVRNGFATVWPFRNRNIEVSIIGDPLHPYAPMQNVNYDPATDGASPPCDIMEVFYEREEDACPANAAGGHTYFNGATWSWDTKGLTPDISTYSGPASPAPGTADYYKLQDHQDYLKYTYHKARVYKTPLDNYVNQGAYTSIASDINPIILPADLFRLFCNADCDEESTPMNLIDGASGPPFTGHDGSVEFNEIDFIDFMEEGINPRGMIESVGSRGTPYARIKVLAKTTVHEMGHTLMNASNSDHCGVSGCIMTGFSTNWDLEPFGSSGCDHAAGGSLDVEGLIHNSVH